MAWIQVSQAIIEMPVYFECFSKYLFFLGLTFILLTTRYICFLGGLPIRGFYWCYQVSENVLLDSDGRPWIETFRHPTYPYDIYDKTIPPVEPFTSARHPRPVRKSFPGLKCGTALPPGFGSYDHRAANKLRLYLEVALPDVPLDSVICWLIDFLWRKHINSAIYTEFTIILASIWLLVGRRFQRLIYAIYCPWIEQFRVGFHICLKYGNAQRILGHLRPKQGHDIRTRSPRYRRMVLSSAYNVDQKVLALKGACQFDTDSHFVVYDNSANTHICNRRDMFEDFQATTRGQVATIGGKLNRPAGIGTVAWTWKDDLGVAHTERLKGVLYFPQSPINIMSITELARQLDDPDGTGIDTKMNSSRFYWQGNKFSRTIHHSPSNLPEPAINEGTSLFSLFTRIFSRTVDDTVHPYCCFVKGHFDTSCSPTIDKDDQDPAFGDIVESLIYPGENLLYKNEGHNSLVKIASSNLNKHGQLLYDVVFPSGDSQKVMRELLS